MKRDKTVLVISDGCEQFARATSLLQDEGYRVLFEKDVSQSMKIAKAESPELIISELAVPNIDGLELCCRMRDDRNLGSTPILLVGDLSKQSSIVEDSFRCGAAGYLQKPIDSLKLIDLCRGIVGLEKPDASKLRHENTFSAMIENVSDVITIIDDTGTILFESPSTNRILGYKTIDFLGKRMFDFVHPADVNEVIEYFSSIHWDAGMSPPLDYRFRHNDGSWRLMESTATPIYDSRFGSAVVVTSHEMTEGKFSLDHALENDTLRTALFDNAATGLALFSPSGRLVKSNAALLQMLDYSENEMHGMLLAEFIFPQEGDDDKLALVQLITGKRRHYQCENGYLTSGGERIWGRLTIDTILDQDNEPQFLIGIFDDPTSRTRMRAATRKVDGSISVGNNNPKILDFNRWVIDKGLIHEN